MSNFHWILLVICGRVDLPEAGPSKKYNLPYYLSLSYALMRLPWVNDTILEGFMSGIVMEGGFDASASEVWVSAMVTLRSNSAPDSGV